MYLSTLIAQVIATLLFTQVRGLEQDGSVLIKLQHSLFGGPNPVFTDRGNISIYSLRVGQAIVQQNALAEEDQKRIQKLAVDNDFYRIKSVVLYNDGSRQSFISYVKACMLAESKLDDRISVSIDYMGRVIGVAVVIASSSSCEGALVPLEDLKEFSTNVYVRQTETGAIPDTVSFVHKLEREREAQEKGEGKDNRSFLAKYWMYIIPFVILMVLSSASNQDNQGGGQ